MALIAYGVPAVQGDVCLGAFVGMGSIAQQTRGALSSRGEPVSKHARRPVLQAVELPCYDFPARHPLTCGLPPEESGLWLA